MVFKGDLSPLSETLKSVWKIGGSEACHFALSIRPENMPTPPWTGENYMPSIKQFAHFGFLRWSKQEDEIFLEFLVAYFDANPGEPLSAPASHCLHKKLGLAGSAKSITDVRLRYRKHWQELLGFPTFKEWSTKRLFLILTMVKRHTETHGLLRKPCDGMYRITGKIDFQEIHLECEVEEQRRLGYQSDEEWAVRVPFRRLSPAAIQTRWLRWRDVACRQDNWASLHSGCSHYNILLYYNITDLDQNDLKECPTWLTDSQNATASLYRVLHNLRLLEKATNAEIPTDKLPSSFSTLLLGGKPLLSFLDPTSLKTPAAQLISAYFLYRQEERWHSRADERKAHAAKANQVAKKPTPISLRTSGIPSWREQSKVNKTGGPTCLQRSEKSDSRIKATTRGTTLPVSVRTSAQPSQNGIAKVAKKPTRREHQRKSIRGTKNIFGKLVGSSPQGTGIQCSGSTPWKGRASTKP